MYYEMNEQLHGIAPYTKKDDVMYSSYFEKDPSEWITGTEPMSVEQRIYLKTLCGEAGVPFDGTLSKASANERIRQLQHRIAARK